MKKQGTANNFTGGLVMDLNPMLTPKNVLVGALNATISTNNGNEGTLLNDMGNTQVETAFLPEGYAPIGTCEYGGIIYIVSYNPVTKHTQIGSFPSPETILTSNELGLKSDTTVNDESFLTEWEGPTIESSGDLSELWKIKIANKSKLVQISEDSLTAGDKFIPYRNNSDLGAWVEDLGKNTEAARVKLTIVSVEDSGRIVDLSDIKETYTQSAYDGDDWYVFDNKDLDQTFITHRNDELETYRKLSSGLQSNYQIFSSKIPGKLGLRFDLIGIDGFDVSYSPIEGPSNLEFDLVFNFSWDGEGLPKYIVCVDTTDGSSKYWTISSGGNGSKDYTVKYEDGVPQFTDDNTILYNEGTMDDQLAILLGRVVYKRFQVGQTRYLDSGEANIRTYQFYPVMEYGVDVELMLEITIDFSKIYSGEYSLTKWKYLLDGESIDVDFSLELYPTFNHEVTSIELKFWDDQDTSIASYYITDRAGYSGDYQITIPLDSVSSLSAMTPPFDLWDSNDKEHHLIYQHKGNLITEVLKKEKEDSDSDVYQLDKEDDWYFNDWGTLYSNSCYLVEIIIRTKLSSEAETTTESPFEGGVETVILKVLWTNGIFNEYYYLEEHTDFTTEKIELQGGATLQLSASKTVDSSGENTDSTQDSQIRELSRLVKYDVTAKITNSLYNGLSTFDLKSTDAIDWNNQVYLSKNKTIVDTDLTTSNQVNRVTRSDYTITDSNGNDITDSIFDSLLAYTDYNDVFLIEAQSETGETIYYLTTNNDYIDTEYAESAVDSTDCKLKETNNTYNWTATLTAKNWYLVKSGNTKQFVILKPLVQSLEEAKNYGFNDLLDWERIVGWQRADWRQKEWDKITVFWNLKGGLHTEVKYIMGDADNLKILFITHMQRWGMFNQFNEIIRTYPITLVVPLAEIKDSYEESDLDTYKFIINWEKGEVSITALSTLDRSNWKDQYLYTRLLGRDTADLIKDGDTGNGPRIFKAGSIFKSATKGPYSFTSYTDSDSDNRMYYLLYQGSETETVNLTLTDEETAASMMYSEFIQSIIGNKPCLVQALSTVGEDCWRFGIDTTNNDDAFKVSYLLEYLTEYPKSITILNTLRSTRAGGLLLRLVGSPGMIFHPFYLLAWPDTSGNIHLTNTFFRLGYSKVVSQKVDGETVYSKYSGIEKDFSKIARDARDLVLSMLSSIYIRKGATQETVPVFIYPGEHTISYEHYLIVNMGHEDYEITNDLLYLGGLRQSLNYSEYITHLLKDHEPIQEVQDHLRIFLKQSLVTFPISYVEDAPLPTLPPDYNVKVESIDSEGITYAEGEAKSSTLYTLEGGSIYPVEGPITFPLYNFTLGTDGTSILLLRQASSIIVESPAIPDIFTYTNGLLLLKNKSYNESADMYRMGVIDLYDEADADEGDQDDVKIHPGGWADCLVNEQLFTDYDFISISLELDEYAYNTNSLTHYKDAKEITSAELPADLNFGESTTYEYNHKDN